MPTNANLNQRPVLAAAVAAGMVMVIFGLGYRILAARLDTPLNMTPVSQEALDQLPMQIGDWTGQEVPVDASIVRATDTDAHVSRRYSRKNSFDSVSLWIASGVKARDLMPHRPEVCYTGAGWTLMDRRSMELPLATEATLPCNVMQFSRGALNTERVMVLDYYIVDGQYSSDVSLLRSKAWRGSGTVGYVAQVQIAAGVPTAADWTMKIVSDFAAESASSIVCLFEPAEEEGLPDEPQELSEGQ